MTILSDRQLMELGHRIINPFSSSLVTMSGQESVISWGLSSYGYDVRCTGNYRIHTPARELVIDPKKSADMVFTDHTGIKCDIPPMSFALCQTMEFITVPDDCLVSVSLKSTYARCGLVIDPVVFEPEWKGYATLALINPTARFIRVYSYEGIVQLTFHRAEERCLVSYKDRKGKYQNQVDITPAKMMV